jgi:diguanylate cyclase (GGDEF)-like protein/PAS domain S-box-containing protein
MEMGSLGTPTPEVHPEANTETESGRSALGPDAAARLVAARAAQNAAQTAEGRNAFLAKASLALGRSLDLQTIAEAAARLPIPQYAVAVFIDIKREDGTVRRISVAHEIEERERRLQEIAEDFVIDPRSPQAAVLETGSPQLGQIDDETEILYPASEQEIKLLSAIHCRAYLALPLSSRGKVFGCITLLSTGRHTYGVAEFTTASEYARRASLAFDHGLLYREALRARAAAEEAEGQFRGLVNGFRESEDRYRALFQDSHDAIYVTRRDGQFVEVNPAALRLFGYTREELLRQKAHILYVDAADRERFSTEIEANGTVRDFELRLRTKDDRILNCLLSSMVRRGTSGDILGYQGIIHDVTARRESENRLRDSEHFTRTIIASVQQGITVYDRNLRYQVFNHFMEELTGIPASAVIGRDPGEVFPHLIENGIMELLARALQGETVHSLDDPFVIKSTGRKGWTSAVYSPHLSPSGEIIGVVGIIMDITERKRAEDQLTHNAFHDDLTGLPNRALFVDRLERLMLHAARHTTYKFAVAFLDLDRFKIVNDSLGHLIGDELLKAIGQRLAGCLRQGDTVARLGGDEFALLLANVHDISDATRVAERVLADLEHPFVLDGHELFSSVSIGIALSAPEYKRPEDILRDADTAMYRAKLEGRSRYEVFDRVMHESAVHVLQFETDLRRALDRNEFMLYYQPIIALDHGKITGFEALIRWKHAKRGIVAPDDFIPLAEETGLIVPIGWWVLEEACRQSVLWNTRFAPPVPLSMSVNLSAKQFLQMDLVEQIDRVMERTGMDPSRLQLEITESVVIRNETSVAQTLTALRERGIQLCLDDFGTGYSSLSYLHAFPIDTLKIDRSFVGKIDTAAENPGLVETIVALSRNLGMGAVAEGVETGEQLEFLRRVGPQFAQGYFFSAALAADQIEDMLARNPVW